MAAERKSNPKGGPYFSDPLIAESHRRPDIALPLLAQAAHARKYMCAPAITALSCAIGAGQAGRGARLDRADRLGN